MQTYVQMHVVLISATVELTLQRKHFLALSAHLLHSTVCPQGLNLMLAGWSSHSKHGCLDTPLGWTAVRVDSVIRLRIIFCFPLRLWHYIFTLEQWLKQHEYIKMIIPVYLKCVYYVPTWTPAHFRPMARATCAMYLKGVHRMGCSQLAQ